MIHYSSVLCKLYLDASEFARYGSRPIDHWEMKTQNGCPVCRLYMWCINRSHCPTHFLETRSLRLSGLNPKLPEMAMLFCVQHFLSWKGYMLFYSLKPRVRTTTFVPLYFIEHGAQRSRNPLSCGSLCQGASTLPRVFITCAWRRNHRYSLFQTLILIARFLQHLHSRVLPKLSIL